MTVCLFSSGNPIVNLPNVGEARPCGLRAKMQRTEAVWKSVWVECALPNEGKCDTWILSKAREQETLTPAATVREKLTMPLTQGHS